MRHTKSSAAILALGLGTGALSVFPRPAGADELAIGAKAPSFTLVGTDGKKHSLAEYAKPAEGAAPKAIAVVFTCNHCPYAQAYEPVLIDMAHRYADKGVTFVLISSNDPKIVPDDSFEKMQARAKEKEYPFPYLYDETQEIAKAYGARVTPHVFLLDSKLMLRYRGRVNDKQDQTQVTSNDLVNALDALLAGKDIETTATRAFGCGIKWKSQS